MLARSVLFLVWALLGMVLSYGALYAFTPFGLLILAPTLAVAWFVPHREDGRSPEIWGLLAGPGLFCFLVAANAEDPAGWIGVGASFVGAALIAFSLAGRARSATSSGP